jgi:ABC-2 type transport system permease protein
VSDFSAAAGLFQRDMRAVLRSRSQVYSSVLTPLLLLVFLGIGVSRGLEPSRLSAGNFTAYLLSGVVVMTVVFSATFSSASYYRDRDSGLQRLLFSSPASPRAILLGKSLAGVAIGLVQAGVVLAIGAPFLDLGWQYGVAAGVLIALAAVLLLDVFLGGVSQVLATRIETMQGFHLLMNLVLFPLLFFSGAFFPIDDLPTWLKVLAYANPLTYAVDALLLALYAEGDEGFIGFAIDFAVLGCLAGAAYSFGLVRVPKLTWSGR